MTNPRFFRKNYLSFYIPLVVILVESIFLLLGSGIYIGEGYLTVEIASSRLVLIAPLVSGVVAYDTARLSSPEHFSMFVNAPRRWFVNYGPFLWAATTSTLIHLAILSGMLIQGEVWNPSVGFLSIVFMAVVQGATLTFFAAIGYAVGSSLSPPLAGGLTTVGTYLVLTIFGPSSATNIFAVTGATIPQIGMTWNLPAQQIRLALLVLGTALLLWGTWRNQNRHSKVFQPLVVLPLLTALAIGPLLFPMDYKKDIDVRESRNSCTEVSTALSSTDVEVCLFDEHSAHLPEFGAMLQKVLQDLEESGLAVEYASTWHELAWGRQVGETSSNPELDDTYYFQIPLPILAQEGAGLAEVVLEDMANILAFPTSCSIDRFNLGFDSSELNFVEAQTSVYGAIYRVLVAGELEFQEGELQEFEQSLGITSAWCEGA